MGIPDCFQGISLIHLVFIRLCCICSHEHLPRLHFLYYNTFTLHIYYSICREICNIHSPAFRLQDRIGIYRLFFLDSNLIHIHYKAERVFLQEKSFSTSPFVYSIDNSMNWFFGSTLCLFYYEQNSKLPLKSRAKLMASNDVRTYSQSKCKKD